VQGQSDSKVGFGRDRMVVLAGLLGISALAWGYLILASFHMRSMQRMGMGMTSSMGTWTSAEVAVLFIMWAVMMVAMMAPTASGMILTFAAINRRRRAQHQPYVATAIFLAGYIVVWSGFALAATIVQWGLHAKALLSPMMVSASPILGGLLLLMAGSFQWTPLKRACLRQCRSPLGFLMTEWREGPLGSFVMGLRHGVYCTGCCGFLMALLFVAGVMNLLWVATITLFVLIEKLAPQGETAGRVTGAALMLAGIALLGQALR
jgi:predicted metal-binding membrane protein